MWASRQMTLTCNPPVNEPEAPTGRNCNTSEPLPRHIATPLQLALFPYGTHSPPMWRRLTLSRPSRVSWQRRLYHSHALLICVILLWRPADYTTRTRTEPERSRAFQSVMNNVNLPVSAWNLNHDYWLFIFSQYIDTISKYEVAVICLAPNSGR